ncbi:MAG: Hsp20/alpha crystallin family protein [Planctomycetes bacterium]|nr:Hsp20/alpha crystallin family protein [Planctomycetota bacterium]
MTGFWNPFRELEALRREFNRVFGGFGGGGAPRSAFLPGMSARTYPLLNVSEDADAFHVEALAPGLDPSALDVSVQGDVLSLSGQKSPIEGIKPEQFHRSERATGRFQRTLHLNADIDEKKVTAHYEGGIITIELPKAEKAKPKQISVSVK